MPFQVGKIYERIEDRFPNDRRIYMFLAGTETQIALYPGDKLMILELQYIKRVRARSGVDREFKRFNEWHVKVLKDDQIGYCNLWEDEWKML